MLKGCACTYITTLFMNCDMEKVVCFLLFFLLGCRGLRKSCLYPQTVSLSVVLSLLSLSPHDCLSATGFNSMLVLYKVRNGGLRYCFL